MQYIEPAIVGAVVLVPLAALCFLAIANVAQDLETLADLLGPSREPTQKPF